MSAVDDGLETRSTQSVHSESRYWDGNATPQTNMASDIRSIGRTLRKHTLIQSGKWRTEQKTLMNSRRRTCMTFPMMTLFMSSGATAPAARAALAACSARSVALWSFSTPPYVPNGVRLAATIKTPKKREQNENFSEDVKHFLQRKLTSGHTLFCQVFVLIWNSNCSEFIYQSLTNSIIFISSNICFCLERQNGRAMFNVNISCFFKFLS